MDVVVAFAFIAIWAGIWWWLAKRMKGNDRNWLVRNLAGSTAGLFAGLVVVAVALELGIIQPAVDPATDVAASPAETMEQATAVTPIKTLGMTPKQYVERLNTLLNTAEQPYRVDAGSITGGDVNDVLNAPIGKHAALVASVSKGTGEILDITVIGAGDGSEASGLEIMIIASAALAAAASDVEFRDVFQGIPAMIKGEERAYGNVKLGAKRMEQLGTWFFASPI